jgi:hypothetical protein
VVNTDGAVTTGGEAGSDAGAGGGGGGGAAGPPGLSLACSSCEKTKCTDPAWVAAMNESEGTDVPADYYADCFEAKDSNGQPTLAADGPAKGKKKADLCRAIVDCVHATGCNVANSNYACYCGANVTAEDCVSQSPGLGPRGACRDVIERGSETTLPLQVAQRRYLAEYAAGAAMHFLLLCESHLETNPTPGVCEAVCTSAGGGCAVSADASADGGDAGGSCVEPADGGSGGMSGAAGSAGAGGGAGGASGASGGGGAGGFDGTCAGGVAPYQALGVAEVAAYDDPATRILFTSTHETDPNDGSDVPVGWGPATLPSAEQRRAAAMLIARIAALLPGSVRNSTNSGPYVVGSSAGIPNATNGLLTVGADPGGLLSGTNLLGVSGGAIDTSVTALDAYRAAAISDAAGPQGPGLPPGLSPSASLSTLGGYISTWATNPASAIGLADNVVNYAVKAGLSALRDAPCPATSSGQAGTSGGGSGSTGASGGAGAGAAGNGGSGAIDAAATFDVSSPACPDLDGNGVSDCAETIISLAGPTIVRNTDTDPAHATDGRTIAAASRCLPVHAGEHYVVAVQVNVAQGQGAGWADFALDELTSADCTGAPATLPYLSPQAFAATGAQTVKGTTTQVPLGIASIAVRLRAVKPVAQPSFEAVFDHLLVHLLATADGGQ